MEVDLVALEQAITPQTRLVLVAHLFGTKIPMRPIIDIAARHKLLIIEDCAQVYRADDIAATRPAM